MRVSRSALVRRAPLAGLGLHVALTQSPPAIARPLPQLINELALTPSGSPDAATFQVVLCADPDRASLDPKDPYNFKSRLRVVTLVRRGSNDYVATTTPKRVVELNTKLNYGGRGAELSELLLLPTGSLLTMDDRTGVVFELLPEGAPQSPQPGWLRDWLAGNGDATKPSVLVPRWILADANGNQPRGFKCEWSTVYTNADGRQVMLVGSHGSPTYDKKGRVDRRLEWVKEIDLSCGSIQHRDWGPIYDSIKKTVGVADPGEIIHEAAAWSDVHQRFFFMPRRVSLTKPDDSNPATGPKLLISCDRSGNAVTSKPVTFKTNDITRGFSAIRFVPGTGDTHIVATRTIEIQVGKESKVESFLVVVHALTGEVLMEDVPLGDQKYEGLELMALEATL